MAIEKQMEMFEDGGLKDEGGSVDPVSGNDVPSGSTQEEVRDDIPAQLSEGEFVLPADVVRYHGLEKIMELRDEAKMGLQKMEDMGQMGNSEEAILDDGVPFSIEDLDMEDVQEYNVGGFVQQQPYGVVQPQTPTNIMQQPSIFANYAQQVQPNQPFQPFVPPQQQQPYTPPQQGGVQQPQLTFQQVMPPSQTDTREYRNAAGEVRFIPFVNNRPVYPIPEGFTEYKPEEVAQVDPTQPIEQPRIGTTQVGDDRGGRDEAGQGPSASQVASQAMGLETGQQGTAGLGGLVGTVLGLAAGIPGMGLLGSAIGKNTQGATQSTVGMPGTVDPATGAVYGPANIPGAGKNADPVSQGFNPVTGQPMAVFSGVPSASHMMSSLSMALGITENPNATPTGYAIVDPMQPTQMMQQTGIPSVQDIIAQNTNMMAAGPATTGLSSQPAQISPEMLGFTNATAGYSVAANNTGVFGSETGDVVSTAMGLGVVNSQGQPVTPQGTVVQMTNPVTGQVVSLLDEDPEVNKSRVEQVQNDIANHNAQQEAEMGLEPFGGAGPDVDTSNDDDNSTGLPGNADGSVGSGVGTSSSSNGGYTAPGGYGGVGSSAAAGGSDPFGGNDMIAHGGYIHKGRKPSVKKQMKKSGLTSKK